MAVGRCVQNPSYASGLDPLSMNGCAASAMGSSDWMLKGKNLGKQTGQAILKRNPCSAHVSLVLPAGGVLPQSRRYVWLHEWHW